MMSAILIIYTLLWTLIYYLLHFSKSKYLARSSQRNNFVTVLHALIVPGITLIYFCTFTEPLSYNYLVNDFIRHIIGMTIGFYIFSVSYMIAAKKQLDKAILIHHFMIGGLLLFPMLSPVFPRIYALILIPQCTALFYHSYLILKETKGTKKETIQRCYDWNFYAWIIFRFGIQGVITFGILYYEFTQYKLPLYIRIITIIGFTVGYVFNVYWLLVMWKKRQEKKQLLN